MANNQLNWSHFRPEFSGTHNEDAEAHLLRMEDWITSHNFPEDHKVGWFCLTLMVEMAKRVFTKEQMDKKAGQSSASPFMQISQSSSKNRDKTEKKDSFSAVEAMERTTDSIERLASLMDRMDTKLDRREDQYRPRVNQGRSIGCSYRQNNYGSRNRSYS